MIHRLRQVFAVLAGPDGPLLVSSLARQLVMLGVLGSFTTFSSLSFQTLNLLNDGQRVRASANLGLSFALCMLAVWIGQLTSHALNQR